MNFEWKRNGKIANCLKYKRINIVVIEEQYTWTWIHCEKKIMINNERNIRKESGY